MQGVNDLLYSSGEMLAKCDVVYLDESSRDGNGMSQVLKFQWVHNIDHFVSMFIVTTFLVVGTCSRCVR